MEHFVEAKRTSQNWKELIKCIVALDSGIENKNDKELSVGYCQPNNQITVSKTQSRFVKIFGRPFTGLYMGPWKILRIPRSLVNRI